MDGKILKFERPNEFMYMGMNWEIARGFILRSPAKICYEITQPETKVGISLVRESDNSDTLPLIHWIEDDFIGFMEKYHNEIGKNFEGDYPIVLVKDYARFSNIDNEEEAK